MKNMRAIFKKIQNTIEFCFRNAAAYVAYESDHQPTHSSAELIGCNDDLLTQILHRLPIISVIRFKSVSKHWLSLLSDRRFTIFYDNHSVSRGLFVSNLYVPFDAENRSTPPFRSLDFYPDHRGIRIIQSCNGLLLCCSDTRTVCFRIYYVFNPTTKQFTISPSIIGGLNVRKSICFMGLAFRQTDCVHYKLVCIYHANQGGLFHIQIYSSVTGKWKISDQSFYAFYCSNFFFGVYWNGAIHWAPTPDHNLYFKVDVEQLQTLPLPFSGKMPYYRSCKGGSRPLYFGESRGHLHLVEGAHEYGRHLHLNVYEMLSDHSGWFIKYQVKLDELPYFYPEMMNSYYHPSSHKCYEFEVCDVVRGEKDEDTFMVVRVARAIIIRYKIVDKCFKEIFRIANIGVTNGDIGHVDVHRYIETLASF